MFSDELEEQNEPEEETVSREDQEKIDDGEVCGNCGGEFVENQAEAALCHDCWLASTEEERKGYIKATSDILPF